MQHFVCTGDCESESPKAGVCETEGCSKEGDMLAECNCEDGLHEGVVSSSDDLDMESMDDEDSF